MTQHYYETTCRGRPVGVVLGWDRPLHGFFMDVEYLDVLPDEEFAYSSLHESSAKAHPRSLRPFLGVLHRLDITLPLAMLRAVQMDAEWDRGNGSTDWTRPTRQLHDVSVTRAERCAAPAR